MTPESIAYEEARRSITEQQEVLESLRSRVGTLVAIATLSTSFLGGLAADAGVGWAGGVAIFFFVVVVALSLTILWPGWSWTFRFDAFQMLNQYVEEDVRVTADEMLRDLAIHHETNYRVNGPQLTRLLSLFAWAIVALGLELLFWIVALTRGNWG